MVKTYTGTGRYPAFNMKRRPRTCLTGEEKEMIEEAYWESFCGARLLRYRIKKRYGCNILHRKIHEYLLKKGYAKPNPKKQRKRRRCRYEREHGPGPASRGTDSCGMAGMSAASGTTHPGGCSASWSSALSMEKTPSWSSMGAEETAGEYHAPYPGC